MISLNGGLMKHLKWLVSLSLLLAISLTVRAQDSGQVAPKPLYRDPVYDGAADPTLIWNPLVKRWWMFYTNRRASAPNLTGVTWVHGTPIGIAESADNGATWSYVSTADIQLPPEFGGKDVTLWAPDVVLGDDHQFHMFLAVVPGIFPDWNHPRSIVHLTSTDLLKWRNAQPLKLASDRVIDPSIIHMHAGLWRMYYNDERAGKAIDFAESPDLNTWTDKGPAIGIDKRCEGPKAFHWQSKLWLIVDEWKGLAVYRSEDEGKTWNKQTDNLLATPGTGPDDQAKGDHCDVVISNDRAYLFYFTHPNKKDSDQMSDTTAHRRSSIQVGEMKLKDGWLTCDRNAPTHINLIP
jgi:hypothetical protein